MTYREVRNILVKLAENNYKEYFKAIISIENETISEETLDRIYLEYMNSDSMQLINDDLIELMKKQNQEVDWIR